MSKTWPHINYIDIGLWKNPYEIDMMVNHVLPQFPNFTYTVHGIEAHPEYCESIRLKYSHNKNINIHNFAVSNTKNVINLYINPSGGLGNSIFKTKNNVDQNISVQVSSNTFSNWLIENHINLDNALNILKVNIEGAELFLWEDIKTTGLRSKFQIICGHPSHDIYKVKELSDKIEYYKTLLSDLDVKIHHFCHTDKPRSISTMTQLIKQLL